MFEIGDKVQVEAPGWQGYTGEVIGEEINGDVQVRLDHSGGYKEFSAADLKKA
ncbi:MAG: hypothetical protein IPK85_02790 [Gemmatimonadetes bacterium]|nr:hypothetical protein [Gemmatimonadota bacterium]